MQACITKSTRNADPEIGGAQMWTHIIDPQKCEGADDCASVCLVTILSLQDDSWEKIANLSCDLVEGVACTARVNAYATGAIAVAET